MITKRRYEPRNGTAP